MAINFPSTAGQATDGSYTYTVAGITYSWDGTSWSAAGAGASATDRTLFSVSTNAAGSAALSYNSNSGVFSYTPPDLSSYLTAEADTLSTVVARGNTAGGNINFGDNNKIIMGDSGDLEIYHNGGNSAAEVSSSQGLFIRANRGFPNADLRIYIQAKEGEASATFIPNGAAELYYDNSKKFETTSTGATITGALTAGGLTYPTSNGNSGQVLTSDGAGNVSWATPTGLQSRTTAQVTQSIANGASVNVSLSTPKTYALLSIATSHEAWVTLYSSTTARTNDAARSETTDPIPGTGVLAEVITTGSTTQLITPGTICFNESGVGTTYAKIVNKSGSTANVQVTLTYVQLEA